MERNHESGRGKLPTSYKLIKSFFINRLLVVGLFFSNPSVLTASEQNQNPSSVDKLLKLNLDLQFFGDLYIPWHILKKTKSSKRHLRLADSIRPIMNLSKINVANFEGVATGAFFPGIAHKKYLLKVPLWLPPLLSDLKIHHVTLGNNHSLDLGYQGLFDTQARLEQAGISWTGAGQNIDVAQRPFVFSVNKQKVCLVSLNRTLPPDFWAKADSPGTAYMNFTQTKVLIEEFKKSCDLVIPIFHWGSEGQKNPKAYQKKLSRLVIDAGAAAVIGHHPHVVQSITSYKGRPIVYSLGNFLFGTKPFKRTSSGVAVGFKISGDWVSEMTIIPLHVDNNEVRFKPQLFPSSKKFDSISPSFQKICLKIKSKNLAYSCDMTKSRFYGKI